MLEAVCRERSLVQCVQGSQVDFSTLEPLSAVNRMVADIAHDLRHPLTAILANAEFLSQTDISDAQRNDFYREICLSIERMNELVSSLLEFSKGRDTLRREVRNIVETVERAIRTTSVKPEFRCVRVRHDHRGPASGWFDSSRLERAIANLVLNACEAVSPVSGEIIVTTISNQRYLRIGVWDNGPGIPAGIQGSLFQPFVSCGKAEGCGLGLAIAKQIVEDHGGKIYLDKSSDGTLIRMTIPFSIPEGAVSRAPLKPLTEAKEGYRKKQQGAQQGHHFVDKAVGGGWHS